MSDEVPEVPSGAEAAGAEAAGAEAAGAEADGAGERGEEAAGKRRGFLAGAPRGLVVLGGVALAFVVVATVIAFGYSKSATPKSKPLSQAQIRRLLGGPASGGPKPGFYRVDRPAPAFTLPPVIGTKPVVLRHLTGHPIVVNFWYSTCPPCQAEAPALAAVSKATAGKVTFVGVDYEDSRSSAAAFIRKHHEDYPDGFDASGNVATQLYAISGTPTTFFLSPNGRRELGVQVGQVSAAQLSQEIRTLYGIQA